MKEIIQHKGILVTLLVLLTISATTACAYAQAERKERPSREAHEALRKELTEKMRAWAQAKIVPQMREWKETLDNAMEPADLEALNKLRTRATALRKEAHTNLKALREAWNTEDYTAMKEIGAKMEKLNEKKIELAEELKPIAITYIATLEEIGAEARPQMKEWKEEGKKMVDEFMQAHADELPGKKGKMHKKMKGMMGMKEFMGMKRMNPEMRKKIMIARFMLWDGADLPEDMEEVAPELNGGFDLE